MGRTDPVEMLGRDPFVVELESVIIEEADKLIEQRWQRRMDYLSARTSRFTSRAILKGLARMMKPKGKGK